MRALLAGVAMAAGLALGCSRPPVDPLRLDRNILTVDNRTSQDWTSVEIWLNSYYRVTTSSIPAKGRFQVPLDAFVDGYARRFNFSKMQIKDLRLTAKLPDGTPLEMKKPFNADGLAAVFEKWER